MVLAVIVHRAPTWSLSGGLCSPPRQVLGRETCTIGEEHPRRQTVRSVGDRPTGRPSSLHQVVLTPLLGSAGYWEGTAPAGAPGGFEIGEEALEVAPV